MQDVAVLLDAIPLPAEGPCLVVWRRFDHPAGSGIDQECAHELLGLLHRKNPDAALVVLGPRDGLDALDVDEMRMLGWQPIPESGS